MPSNPRSLDPETCVSVRLKEISLSGILNLPVGDEVVDLRGTNGLVGSVEGIGRCSVVFYAGAVLVLAAAGSLSLSPLWQTMCHLWATDPLRSIGAVFPLVACWGVLAAWRRLGWGMSGTFWALPIIASSILLARAIAISDFAVGYDGHRLGLINFGTVLFLYGIGVVLLFGGTYLLRASLPCLCLLLFINPVPQIFSSAVDLPLQQLSASTARSFAHLLGLQPTGEQLRMMFAPDFGMFIAPGCNGVRGSITLGYLALFFGYARRLRPWTMALTTLTALLLGYALNFLRLCVLVIYYRIGIGFPPIQKHGAGIDYSIGCTLCLFATLGLGLLIRSLEPSTVAGIQRPKERLETGSSGFTPRARHSSHIAVARVLCFFVLVLVFIVQGLRSAPWHSVRRPNEQEVLGSFPVRVGPYRLNRTWAEHSSNGVIALAMAEYSTSSDTGNAAKSFTFGLWVGSANHLVADSKRIQGILAQWTGSFDATTLRAPPVHFITSFYDDGISRQYDAESTCSAHGCSDHFSDSNHRGFFFKAPELSDLAFAPGGNSLPILLRREWLDSDPTSSADLRAQFESDARLFIAQVDLQSLVVQDGNQP